MKWWIREEQQAINSLSSLGSFLGQIWDSPISLFFVFFLFLFFSCIPDPRISPSFNQTMTKISGPIWIPIPWRGLHKICLPVKLCFYFYFQHNKVRYWSRQARVHGVAKSQTWLSDWAHVHLTYLEIIFGHWRKRFNFFKCFNYLQTNTSHWFMELLLSYDIYFHGLNSVLDYFPFLIHFLSFWL